MEDEEEGEGRGILNPGADACGGRYDRPKSSFQLSCGTHPQLFIFHYSFQNGLIFKKNAEVFFLNLRLLWRNSQRYNASKSKRYKKSLLLSLRVLSKSKTFSILDSQIKLAKSQGLNISALKLKLHWEELHHYEPL